MYGIVELCLNCAAILFVGAVKASSDDSGSMVCNVAAITAFTQGGKMATTHTVTVKLNKALFRTLEDCLQLFADDYTRMQFALEAIWRMAEEEKPYDSIERMAYFGLGREQG